jgi:hypothetical protein
MSIALRFSDLALVAASALLSLPAVAQVQVVPVAPVPVAAVPVAPIRVTPVPVAPVPVAPLPVTAARPAAVARAVFAVLPLSAHDVDETLRETLESELRAVSSRVLSPAGYTVLSGDTTMEGLANSGVDRDAVCGESCVVDSIRSLHTNYIIAGGLRRDDSGLYVAFIRLFDSTTGRQLSATTLEGASIRQLRAAFEGNAHAFFAPVLAPPTPVAVSSGGFFWATSAVSSSEYSDASWATHQVLGAPNTPLCDNAVTAWATKAPDAPNEWLEVRWPAAVTTRTVRIVEAYNPGAISEVRVHTPEGWMRLWAGRDPTRACPGNFDLALNAALMVDAVHIVLVSEQVKGWNEIDAVGLSPNAQAVAGPRPLRKVWATGAHASSQLSDQDWSSWQATGAPNTSSCGDSSLAWATRDADRPNEWIELVYGQRQLSAGVEIYETFNPGAVAAVEVRLPDGSWTTVSSTSDTNHACPGIYRLMFPQPMAVDAVRLRLASERVPGFNEIDAVALLVE